MAVTPHGSRWRVDLSEMKDGKRNRVRRNFATEAQAKMWEAGAILRLEQGLPLEEITNTRPSSVWTMGSLLDAVHARYWKGKANEENALRNASECVHILGPKRHPSEITAIDVDDLVRKLVDKGNADGTINRKLAALSKMMNHALSRGIIEKKIVIEKKRETAGRLRWYTVSEERKILGLIQDENFKDLVIFLADSGCRLGEALRLQWRDVDDYARFHETKNGSPRAIPLTPRLKSLLAARRARVSPDPTASVFPGSIDTAGNSWQVVRKAAGLMDDPQAVLHTWRHTCASRMAQAGVPIQVIQQWLGHKDIKVTLRYAHLCPVNLQDAAKVLQAVVTASPEQVRGEDAPSSVSSSAIDQIQAAA